MMMAIFKSSGDRETSLLAEAPLLGKLAKLQYFPGKSWKAAFLQDYFKRVLKTKRWNIKNLLECSNLPLKSEYVQQGTVIIF